MSSSVEEKDVFCRQDIYPDAKGLIAWSPVSLDQVKESAVVVMDTNALLVPYLTGKASLTEIGEKYRTLAADSKLVVPGQVMREFAGNRVQKLQELYSQINKKLQLNIPRGAYPLFEGLNGYEQMTEIEAKLDKEMPAYRAAVDSVLENIRKWYWDDPVSQLYKELFVGDVVCDPPIDREKLKHELERRVKNTIPPGYKDARKEDGGIGDLLIWHTILEIGKMSNKHLIFVTGEEKTDWWHKSEGRPLYPRFELIDEYRRASEGKTLHLISFSAFLELFGASKNIVDEVRKEEQEIQTAPQRAALEFSISRDSAALAERAVYEWLRRIHSDGRVTPIKGFPDYIVDRRDGKRLGYEVKLMGSKLERRMAEVPTSEYEHFDRLYFVVVARDDRSLASALRFVSSFPLPSKGSFVAGHLEASGAHGPPVFVPDVEEPRRWAM